MSTWERGGRFEQYRFGKRKPIVKGGPKRPLPRWERVRKEIAEQAERRRITDEFKRIIYSSNPNASTFSIYGVALINGKRQKFSFDIAFTGSPSPRYNKFIFRTMRDLHDKILAGKMPKRYYYGWYFEDSILRSMTVDHGGVVEMTQSVKSPRKGERAGKWTPGSRKIKSEKKLAAEVASKLRAREKYEREMRGFRWQR